MVIGKVRADGDVLRRETDRGHGPSHRSNI